MKLMDIADNITSHVIWMENSKKAGTRFYVDELCYYIEVEKKGRLIDIHIRREKEITHTLNYYIKDISVLYPELRNVILRFMIKRIEKDKGGK